MSNEEKAISILHKVHTEISKLKIPMDEYNPISSMLIEAKQLLYPSTHQQGEPKTDEAVNIFKKHWKLKTGKDADDAIMDHMEYCIDAMNEFAASERAQIIAEQKTEIPQCLQECRSKDDARTYANDRFPKKEDYELTSIAYDSFLKGQEKAFEKFSALLSQVKGLPEQDELQNEIRMFFSDNLDPDSFSRTSFNASVDIEKYVREKFSLSLLQRDEAHKAEMEQKEKLWLQIIGLSNTWPLTGVLSKLIEATNILLHKKNYDGAYYEEMGICVTRAEEIKSGINLFLKEKEGKRE